MALSQERSRQGRYLTQVVFCHLAEIVVLVVDLGDQFVDVEVEPFLVGLQLRLSDLPLVVWTQ